MATKKNGDAAAKYPHGDTSWFVRDRFGMFIHWGLYSMPARHEWVRHNEKIPNEVYDEKYFARFDPDLYDPTVWAKAAKRAGMKYFVITTKHHEGFCLWDSKFTGYKATKTPYGKDLLKPMVKAFRDEGIRVGFYYSLIDWHHDQFPVDRIHPQREDKAFREKTKGRDVTKYTEYLHNQVRELLTQFGTVDVMWFDFSYPGEDGKGRDAWQSEKLFKMIRKLQPDVVVDNRLDLPGTGDFETPEQYQPREGVRDEKGNPQVWEACQTFSGSWGYHRDELTWKSVNMLLGMLVDGVSKGGNLLLNVGPTARGELDYRAMERLEGIGKWMRVHGRSIYGCGAAPAGLVAPPDCRYTYNAETNRLYLHILSWPFGLVHAPGLASKVEYAQFLHDGSEVLTKGLEPWQIKAGGMDAQDLLSFNIPIVKPNTEIPVIELFLKKP